MRPDGLRTGPGGPCGRTCVAGKRYESSAGSSQQSRPVTGGGGSVEGVGQEGGLGSKSEGTFFRFERRDGTH